MAIYHLTAKTGSRNGGQSAKAKADYIQREGRYSRDREEVLHTQSGHLPEWAERPADYWDGADLYERANGRLFKEIEFALPVELTLDQQRELVDEFARHLTEGERLPYTLAIHAGNGENPHCHLMISERKNDGIERPADQWFKRYNGKQPERGGAQKSESLKPKAWLEQTREAWSHYANRALEQAGHEAHIDHRTLEAQGIELPGDQKCDIYIGSIGDAASLVAAKLCTDLRSDGVSAQFDVAGRSVKAQMKYADKLGARFTCVIGDDDIAKGEVLVKNMENGEKTAFSIENFSDEFSSALVQAAANAFADSINDGDLNAADISNLFGGLR